MTDDARIEHGDLAAALIAQMDQATWNRIGSLTLRNIEENRPFFGRGRSIAKLHKAPFGAGDSAIVVAAGPSVRHQNPIPKIRDANYRGGLVVTDSAMYNCLRNQVIPDLVVTVDPHHERMLRWFGDPGMSHESLEKDDYFRRQDLDDSFAREIQVNDQIMALMREYGSQIRIALSVGSAPNLVRRVFEIGMDVFWWLPMLDDPDSTDGITARLMAETGFPAINAGGNVGTSCWMIAEAILEKKHVALVGIDFSYYENTPYRSTQYYYELSNIVGEENLGKAFVRIYNPYEKAWYYTDPAYMWYRNGFLDLARIADCTTYNCTEGGILFGDGIQFIPLQDFLGRFSGKARGN